MCELHLHGEVAPESLSARLFPAAPLDKDLYLIQVIAQANERAVKTPLFILDDKRLPQWSLEHFLFLVSVHFDVEAPYF